MAKLSTTRNYADAKTPTSSQFDSFVDDIESFLNNTKINSDNIQSAAVTTSHLKAESITEAKLNEDSITTAKILDSAATKAKFKAPNIKSDGSDPGSGGFCFSTPSGDFGTTSTSEVTVDNLSCTLTSNGRPVFLAIISKSNASPYIGWDLADDSDNRDTTKSHLYFYQDSSVIGHYAYTCDISNGSSYEFHDSATVYLPNTPMCIVTPAAGTYTYVVKAKVSDSSHEFRVYNLELVAFEL